MSLKFIAALGLFVAVFGAWSWQARTSNFPEGTWGREYTLKKLPRENAWETTLPKLSGPTHNVIVMFFSKATAIAKEDGLEEWRLQEKPDSSKTYIQGDDGAWYEVPRGPGSSTFERRSES